MGSSTVDHRDAVLLQIIDSFPFKTYSQPYAVTVSCAFIGFKLAVVRNLLDIILPAGNISSEIIFNQIPVCWQMFVIVSICVEVI